VAVTGERVCLLDSDEHRILMELHVSRASNTKVKPQTLSSADAATEQGNYVALKLSHGTSERSNSRKRSHNDPNNKAMKKQTKSNETDYVEAYEDAVGDGSDSEPCKIRNKGDFSKQLQSVIVLNDEDDETVD
jgi:hypothetical protein